MILQTSSTQWQTVRSLVAAVDSGGSYDPVGTATDRFVSRMTNASDALVTVIDVSTANAMELRSHFSAAGSIATINIFVARENDTAVKHVASIALTKGTQTNADGRFFATTSVVTPYWAPERIGNTDVESGTGISSVFFDKLGYDRAWIIVSALNGGNLSIEASGY